MPKTTYVNGRYLPHGSAAVHIEDRGFQFADGVYEVICVYDRILVDLNLHLDRLDRSLRELEIPLSKSRRTLKIILKEIVWRNRIVNGSVYLQITRGSAVREFAYANDLTPSLIIYARKSARLNFESINIGHKIISKPDIRWKRSDIKSISLLPAVLAKQAAVNVGADESWFVNEEGFVTEGTSSNAWIVTARDELITRPLDNLILPGITRHRILALAKKQDFEFIERPFLIKEALESKEAFCTSSTSPIKPIIEIDNHEIGDGRVGPVTRLLIEHYLHYMDNLNEK